jgi:hypothetical protein
MKKINKKQAFKLVKQLNVGELSLEQKADLLYYFMPPKPRKPKERYEWLAGFIAKQDVRVYFNYIYVNDANIVACNGHCLAVIKNIEKLQNGYYTYFKGNLKPVNSNIIEPSVSFADYKRLITKVETYKYENLKRDDFFKGHDFLTHIGDLDFQAKYLDLVDGCYCHIDTNHKMGYFKSKFGYALIKSMRA